VRKMAQIKLEAPAKINLVLEVLGKREDCYHEIRTIFQSISLCDMITLREIKNGVKLHLCKAPTTICRVNSATTSRINSATTSRINSATTSRINSATTSRVNSATTSRINSATTSRINSATTTYIKPSENLAYKAALLFLKSSGIKKGVEVYLEKNIPVGSGLGGGSSNAASVLLGLNKLWKVGFTRDNLKMMALKIGMDVPFFIDGGMAYATGRGERVRKVSPHPSFWVLLIDPGFPISTKWAYDNIDNSLLLTKNHSYAKIMLNAIKKRSIKKIAGFLFNRFEELINKEYPNFLENTKCKLADAGAIGTLMTGSGPVVFGIVEGRRDAYRGLERIRSTTKEKVYLAKTIGGSWR